MYGESSEHPVITAKAAEVMCRAQAAPSKTGATDIKLQWCPVIQLSKWGE